MVNASRVSGRLSAPMVVVVVGALAAVGCGSNNAASKIQPDAPSGSQALGDRADCHSVSGGGAPLIVDWPTDQRTDLELAMKKSVAVVEYDCSHIKVLRDCSVDGDYAFSGVSIKEEIVQLESADEIQANLPLGGLGIVGKIGGDLKTGTSLNIGYMLIGERRTTVTLADKASLKGSCSGATHFVKRATIGAFAMTAGAKAAVSSVADVFTASASASSSSGKSVTNRDGQLDACKSANPDGTEPPGQCRSVIRLELVPVGGPAAEPASGGGRSAASTGGSLTCAAGMVAVGGKCTSTPPPNVGHRCQPGNLADCTRQCGLHDAASCNALGVMYANGEGTAPDRHKAFDLWTQACQASNPDACWYAGDTLLRADWPGHNVNQGVEMYEKACRLGAGGACAAAGLLWNGSAGHAKDLHREALLYQKGCDLGAPNACGELGVSYFNGEGGLPVDRAKALALHRRACFGGYQRSCSATQSSTSSSPPPPSDPAGRTRPRPPGSR